MKNKRTEMTKFWSNRAKEFSADPRANTNDIWLREVEIGRVDKILKTCRIANALDFGCANGYTTRRLAKINGKCKFVGIDINRDMIRVAKETHTDGNLPNLTFQQVDILSSPFKRKFDLIYSIRVFQNIESLEMQCKVFDRLMQFLKPEGLFFFIESYADGYAQINKDRLGMGLTLLPIHKHLTLLTEGFEKHVSEQLSLVEKSSPSSSYYLITRLLYSYIAKMNNEQIDYNHPIHQTAAIVPNIGNYGPQRACLFKKNR
jgi:SAM-dependent methyltransferase